MIRFTLEGRKLLLLTLFIAVAAVNTGNNLIYLILAMLVSIVAVSVIAPFINTSGLALAIAPQGALFAGQGAQLEVTVLNLKKRVDSYSLGIRLGEEARAQMDFVTAGGQGTAKADATFKRRGLYRFGDAVVASGFPFIVSERSVSVDVRGEVLVYPRVVEVRGMMAEFMGQAEGGMTIRRGGSDEMLGIRELRLGDEMKHVSWRVSAKAGRLMVREFAELAPRTVTLVLDDSGPLEPEAFESAVTLAASVASRLLEEGYYVRLLTTHKVVPFGSGPEHLHRVLEVLALAEEGAAGAPLEKWEHAQPAILFLKSPASPMGVLASEFDLVIYASDV